MDTHTAPEYLRANFASADRLAVVALNRTTADTKQRIATAERISQDDFQRWLRFLNKEHYEIYVSMNTIREDANGRKKSDIAQIRHVYLDFDVNGSEAVRQMLDRGDMPAPNHLIESSPGKWQTTGASRASKRPRRKISCVAWCANSAPIPPQWIAPVSSVYQVSITTNTKCPTSCVCRTLPLKSTLRSNFRASAFPNWLRG